MAATNGRANDLQAIILAGGKGERLRPFTDDRPKPMVLILERPILEYQVRWLAAQGVKRVVFSCGYRHEVIESYFEDGAKFGVDIRDEPDRLAGRSRPNWIARRYGSDWESGQSRPNWISRK